MFSKKISQQHWQEQPLQEKFLVYEKAYAITGYTSFPALKIVASMAHKGTVFTPHRAKQILHSIQTATTQLSQVITQIQVEIDALFGLSSYTRLQVPLRNLSKHISTLMQGIEKEILSIAGLTSSEHETLEQHFSTINYARTYLLERLSIDIKAAQAGNLSNLQRVEKYLTLIESSAHELTIIAQKTIEQRVPFYYIH